MGEAPQSAICCIERYLLTAQGQVVASFKVNLSPTPVQCRPSSRTDNMAVFQLQWQMFRHSMLNKQAKNA